MCTWLVLLFPPLHPLHTEEQDLYRCVVLAAPCHRRAEEVEGYDEAAEQLIETDAEGDGWVSTGQASHQSTAEASIPDLDSNPNQAGASADAVDADDDIPDIDDLAIEDEDDEVDLPLLPLVNSVAEAQTHRAGHYKQQTHFALQHDQFYCISHLGCVLVHRPYHEVAHSMLQSALV